MLTSPGLLYAVVSSFVGHCISPKPRTRAAARVLRTKKLTRVLLGGGWHVKQINAGYYRSRSLWRIDLCIHLPQEAAMDG